MRRMVDRSAAQTRCRWWRSRWRRIAAASAGAPHAGLARGGASAAVAAVALLWLPLGSTPALAFAQVQQHFRDFRTLRFDIEQRMNGAGRS